MIDFHAVMIDETGCEFGVSFRAKSRGAAQAYLRREYPESRCDQLETRSEAAKRERNTYLRAQREYDNEY